MAASDHAHGLFFAHLVIEKLSKAHWVQDNLGGIPPRTHSILRLWQTTQLAPTPDQEGTATVLNDYQLEGRYPDYQRQLNVTTTAAYAQQLLAEITTLRTWLLSSLP